MKWAKRVMLFIGLTLAGHILEIGFDKAATSASAHPLSYWLHYLPTLSNGYSRVLIWAALFFGGMSLRDYYKKQKQLPTSQDEKLPASRGKSPAEAVNVKLIPANGPSTVQLLEVKNLGPRQTFRADCTLLRRRNDRNQLQCSTCRMEWDYQDRRTSGKLSRGGSRNLVVAIADNKRGIDRGHPYEMEWIAITGLSENGQRKEIQRSTWNHGEALPEYDLKITITSDDQEPHVECFTLKAGQTSALEMLAIACEQNAEPGNVVTDRDQALRARADKSKRTSAEQHHYEVARVALGKLGPEAVTALQHLKTHGTLTFGTYAPPLPVGMNNDKALRIYNDCLTAELVTRRGTYEMTFEIAPPMRSVLDELLYGSDPTTSADWQRD